MLDMKGLPGHALGLSVCAKIHHHRRDLNGRRHAGIAQIRAVGATPAHAGNDGSARPELRGEFLDRPMIS